MRDLKKRFSRIFVLLLCGSILFSVLSVQTLSAESDTDPIDAAGTADTIATSVESGTSATVDETDINDANSSLGPGEEGGNNEETEEYGGTSVENESSVESGSSLVETADRELTEPERSESEEHTEDADEAFSDDMPATTFNASPDGDTIIEIKAEEDTFPTGTVMTAEVVSDEPTLNKAATMVGDGVSDVLAYAITFTCDGEPVQPLKPVHVKITSPRFAAEEETSTVVHIEEDGSGVIIEQTNEGSEASEKSVCFQAASFSVYAVVFTKNEETSEDSFSMPQKAPLRAPGEDEESLPSGTTGTVTWGLTRNVDGETYTLSFDGEGEIPNNFFNSIKGQLNNFLDKLTEMHFGAGITKIGYMAFRGTYSEQALPALKSITFAENSQLQELGNNAFECCSNQLQSVDFTGTQLTGLSYSAFLNCKGLTSLVLPNTVTSIGSYALYGCTSLVNFQIPPQVTSIGNYCFRETQIASMTIPGSVKTIGLSAFASMYQLESLVFEENYNLTTLPEEMCNYDRSLSTLDLSGLRKLTTLSKRVFQTNNGSLLTGPVEVIVGAENLTNVNGEVFGLNANLQGESITLRIKNTVNTLSETLFTATGSRITAYFDPDMDFTIQSGASTTIAAMNPFSNLPGEYTVDSAGVIYRLHDNGEATLFYCPPGINAYNVPATITSKAGKTYTITEVGGSAFRLAADLTALTFSAPGQVSLLVDSLRYTNLQTVQGQTVIDPNTFRSISRLNGFPTKGDSDGLKSEAQVTYTDALNQVLVLNINNGDSARLDENHIYQYLTGESAMVWFSVNNENNAVMSDRVIRIYLAFDDDGHELGTYQAGKLYQVVNTSPGTGGETTTHTYPLNVVYSGKEGIYYYDLSGLEPGDVMAFSNGYMYNNISSNGGNLKVWAKVLTKDEAEASKEVVFEPTEYIQMHWTTRPNTFSLSKAPTSISSWKLAADGTENGSIYASGLQWEMKFTAGTDGETTNGKDYVVSCDYEDSIILPDELHWDEAVIQAIRDKAIRMDKADPNNRYTTCYVTVNGEEKVLFRVRNYYNNNGGYSQYAENVSAEVDDAGKVVLKWTIPQPSGYTGRNKAGETYATREIPAGTVTLALGNEVVVAEENKLADNNGKAKEIKVSNTVNETHHYSYSEDGHLTAETTQTKLSIPVGLSMEKRATVTQRYLGEDLPYTISIINKGIITSEDVHTVKDDLRPIHWITPENLENMFADEQWGDYLTVTISPATLCKTISGTVTTVNNENATLYQQITGEDAPHNGMTGTDPAQISENNTLVLKKQGGNIQITNGTQTITIGEGESNTSLREVLETMGYLVTYDVGYHVQWDLPEEKKLYGGQTWQFEIPASVKNTLQLLKEDTPHRYYTAEGTDTNASYAYNKDGKQILSGVSNIYAWNNSFKWQRELSLGKSASVNGTPVEDGILTVTDGDYIGYTLSFNNLAGNYETLPLVDRMWGAQVLLVPVEYNAALSNMGLETITQAEGPYAGTYYVLNKEGTYEKLTLGGEDYTLAKVVVQKNTEGLETLLYWYFKDQGVGGNSVSYVALADSSRCEITSKPDAALFTLGNECWLGDHAAHRLYASLPGSVSRAEFSKWIELEDGTLTRHSVFKEGEQVRYRIKIQNRSNSEMTISGDRIYDRLPSTRDVFAWTKDTVKQIVYEPVKRQGLDTASCETTEESYWSLTKKNPTVENTEEDETGQYYIQWSNDFLMTIQAGGEMDILVTL